MALRNRAGGCRIPVDAGLVDRVSPCRWDRRGWQSGTKKSSGGRQFAGAGPITERGAKTPTSLKRTRVGGGLCTQPPEGSTGVRADELGAVIPHFRARIRLVGARAPDQGASEVLPRPREDLGVRLDPDPRRPGRHTHRPIPE